MGPLQEVIADIVALYGFGPRRRRPGGRYGDRSALSANGSGRWSSSPYPSHTDMARGRPH